MDNKILITHAGGEREIAEEYSYRRGSGGRVMDGIESGLGMAGRCV